MKATVAADSAAPATCVLDTPTSASVTVNDNDPSPVVTLLLSDSTISEAVGVTEIRAMLSGPSAVETRVTISIPAEVLDAVELDADPVLVIPAGVTESPNAVTLTAVDNDVEASEDLSVAVSGVAENTVGVTDPAPMTLTVTDDDIATPMDNTAPLVGIDVPTTSNAPFPATITFNEVVSGFTVDDVMVSSTAALSDFTETTTGTVWTVLVTPTADGVVTLNIAAGVARDAANNGNMTAPQARSTYSPPVQEEPSSTTPTTPVRDTTAPRVIFILRHDPGVSPTNADSLTWRVTFLETVENVDNLDFTVSGSTATVSNVEQVNREENVYDVTVSGGDLASFNGTVTLGFASGRNITETTTGTVWTALVTPTADGVMTLDIAADVATDAAGNGNTAAAQARSTYTAPAMDTEAKEEAKAVLNEVVLPDVIQQLTAQTIEVITSRLNSITSGSPSAPLTLSLDGVEADTVAFFHGERERLKNGSME